MGFFVIDEFRKSGLGTRRITSFPLSTPRPGGFLYKASHQKTVIGKMLLNFHSVTRPSTPARFKRVAPFAGKSHERSLSPVLITQLSLRFSRFGIFAASFLGSIYYDALVNGDYQSSFLVIIKVGLYSRKDQTNAQNNNRFSNL